MTDGGHFDVIVIGSGFGGGVSALRLTEKGYRVAVLEAGRRFEPPDFPKTSWDVRRFFWAPRFGMRGILRMTLLRHSLVLSGAGVGGGSLVYANTLYRPHEAFYVDPQWSDITDWKDELAPHYDTAERMLGVTTARAHHPSDQVLFRVAERMGVADTFRPTPIGVFQGEPGVEVDDPYFGGAGPRRTGCLECGSCMTGCPHGAKNSIDRNYLYLAEAGGATVFAEHEVVDIERRSGGFAVTATRPGRRSARHTRRFTADQVVLAAGALGTTGLLLRLHRAGRLPAISDRLGHVVRTNSEAIIGASGLNDTTDYSHGVAIASSIHTRADTHIEAVRYGKGSNAMGLLATVMVDGGGRIPRQLRFLLTVLRRPVAFLRSLSVRRWAERTLILLVMQSSDNRIRLRLKGRRVVSDLDGGTLPPTYIPDGNRAARYAAEEMGGIPGSAINEVLLDTPTTAHLLGGACLGADPGVGVVDPYHRVFGEPGLHVVDGAAVGANLGVNPSLSITAMAERAMSLWPNRGEADPRPPVGSDYLRLPPIPARRPALR